MFSPRLKSARANAGLSQTALAKAVGLSQSYLAQLEAGDREPSLETIKSLANALSLNPGWLMGEEVQEPGHGNGGDPQAAILTDYQAPPGLRDLAGDKALVKVLAIQPHEWVALRSLRVPSHPNKEGYMALLHVLRAICPV